MFDRKGVPLPCARKVAPLRIHPVSITAGGMVVVDPDTAISRDGFVPDQVVPAVPGAGHDAVKSMERA